MGYRAGKKTWKEGGVETNPKLAKIIYLET